MDTRHFGVARGDSRLLAARTVQPGQAAGPDTVDGDLLRLQLEVEHLRAVASALMADLSNHWTAVVGSLELGHWGGTDAVGGQMHKTLRSSVMASAHLLRSGTRAFVRYQRPPVDVRLAGLLETLADHLASRLPRSARLAYQIEEGLPIVRADELLLAQLIDELVSNAADQIESDETIRIGTRQVPSCPPYEPGHYLRCYRFVGSALEVSVSWRSPQQSDPDTAPQSLETAFLDVERLLAVKGALHLDLSLAIHLDESEPGVRTASVLIPTDYTDTRLR